MKARPMFEAVMRGKGYTDFSMLKGKYTATTMQTRWIYFQLDWEMRGVAG